MPNDEAQSIGPRAAEAAVERAEAITKALATAPDATDHAAVRAFGHTLIELGCAVLFIVPGTKVPADMRPPQQRRKRRNDYESAKGGGYSESAPKDGGVYLATTDAEEFDGYLTRYARKYGPGCAVNLAIVPGRSRLVVVDADTAEQVAAFRADAGPDADTTPTVRSPGQVAPDGTTWAHRDGGHFWFVVPEGVELPDRVQTMTPEGGYAVFWGTGKYVLIPPSRRPEGNYECTGAVVTLPDTVGSAITDHATARAVRAARSRERTTTGDLDAAQRWGGETSWDEILAPTQWTNTGKTYSECGCDIWAAPGLHASERSAIAHEPGCSAFDSPDPPLYCFTDHDCHPLDTVIATHGRTVTRLRAYAAIHHDNDLGAALDNLNIDLTPNLSVDCDPGEVNGQGRPGVAGPTPKGRVLEMTWAADISDDVPTWAWEYDGYGRIIRGAVCTFAGRPGAGKSTAARWFVAGYTTGTISGCFHGEPQNVAYISSEESWEYVVKPGLRAAGADMRRVARFRALMNGKVVKLLGLDDERAMIEKFLAAGVSVVVVDPFMGTVEGKTDIYRPNEAREAAEPWQRIAEAINGVVILVHHLVKAPNGDVLAAMQGASAFGELTRGAFAFVKADDDTRIMSQTKNSAGREDLSVTYTLDPVQVTTDSGASAEVTRFAIVGASDRDASDVLREQARGGGGGRGGGSAEVALWLGTYLADGPRWAAPGYRAAELAGFSEDRVKRARRTCDIRSVKSGERWYWATEAQLAAEMTPIDEPPGGVEYPPVAPLVVNPFEH